MPMRSARCRNIGHRSLQEFLVAEELIRTDLGAHGQQGIGDLVSVLRLINREIASFIVEAASENPEIRSRASDWFGQLRGVRRTDMPRSGIRLFAELAAIPEMAAPEFGVADGGLSDPWFPWIEYFAANNVVEFAPRTQRAAEFVPNVLPVWMSPGKSQDMQAGVLLLAANALAESHDFARLWGHLIVSEWLDPETIENALARARKVGRMDHHYIRLDENLPFWTFLHIALRWCAPLKAWPCA